MGKTFSRTAQKAMLAAEDTAKKALKTTEVSEKQVVSKEQERPFVKPPVTAAQ